MRRSDLISGTALLLFGLLMIFVIVPQQIDSSGDYGVDPKIFPLTMLWLTIFVSALLVIGRLFEPRLRNDEPPMRKPDWLFIVAASVFLVAAFLAVRHLGFVAAGTLIIALLMFAMGVRRNWVKLIGVSVGAPVFIYYALLHLFQVQLP